MTNATTIRTAVKAEADNLAYEGNKSAATALREFAASATPAELIRFRDLLLSVTDSDLEVHNAD